MTNTLRGCVTMVVAVGILCLGITAAADDSQQRATPTPKPAKAAKTPRVNRPAKSGPQRTGADRARARERRENEQRRRKAMRRAEDRDQRDKAVRNRMAIRTAPAQPTVTPTSGYLSTPGLSDAATSRARVQTNLPDPVSTAPRAAATPSHTPVPAVSKP